MSALEPLPHAPIGTVLGLVEYLRETPAGREDLYKLGGPLGYELDDLLPVTEAAKQMGLVRIEAGDIELTLDGRTMASAEDCDRRRLLATHLATLPLIAEIREALLTRAERRVRKKAFVDLLEERYSPGEAEKQIATALEWARYGELFDFDPDTEEFVLPPPS
jgi:NitT/TauT family transport system ATP-binding protein